MELICNVPPGTRPLVDHAHTWHTWHNGTMAHSLTFSPFVASVEKDRARASRRDFDGSAPFSPVAIVHQVPVLPPLCRGWCVRACTVLCGAGV